MTDVRVAGVGLTQFGTHPDRTGRDLFGEAALRAFEDAGVPRGDVEELNYGNFMGALAEHQGHQAPLMAEAAGVRCPATRYESPVPPRAWRCVRRSGRWRRATPTSRSRAGWNA